MVRTPLESVLGLLLLVIPLGYYALYAFTIRALSKAKTESIRSNPDFMPFVSVVIPTYNEIKMIERRVKNFDSLEYPHDQMEVIFVDGKSTDGTAELINRLRSGGREYIRLVQQSSRQGYNSAIYEGICQARSDIVVTGEAGSFFHPKAIASVVRHLADSSTGVATGKSVLYNPDESLATRLEAAYRDTHDALRLSESVVDSTPDMKGELLAFRKEVGLKLQPRVTLPDSASFDMSISYLSRSLGLRAVFEPDAIFYEYAPRTMRERMIVQIRRGTAFTGALWNFRSMMLRRKFGYFGTLIAPSHALILIVFPWMLLIAPFVLMAESLNNPLAGAIVLSLGIVALLYGKLRYRFLSFVFSQIVLGIATIRLLLRRHTQIIDTVTTARR